MKLMTKALEKRFAKVTGTPVGDTATVIAHYFNIKGSDWWATSYDPEVRCLFGFACVNGWTDLAEWGYFSLDEFEDVNKKVVLGKIERDLYWDEKPFKQCWTH